MKNPERYTVANLYEQIIKLEDINTDLLEALIKAKDTIDYTIKRLKVHDLAYGELKERSNQMKRVITKATK